MRNSEEFLSKEYSKCVSRKIGLVVPGEGGPAASVFVAIITF